jgi:hypothetical protein
MMTDWQQQEQENEQARQRNVQTFLRMWLSLGADCIKAVGNRHADEINEALGLAASRWEQLLAIEKQIPNDEARLATLERGRVPDPTDAYVPKDVLAKKDADHLNRVEGARGALKSLKEEAKRGRKELESFIAKAR